MKYAQKVNGVFHTAEAWKCQDCVATSNLARVTLNPTRRAVTKL